MTYLQRIQQIGKTNKSVNNIAHKKAWQRKSINLIGIVYYQRE